MKVKTIAGIGISFLAVHSVIAILLESKNPIEHENYRIVATENPMHNNEGNSQQEMLQSNGANSLIGEDCFMKKKCYYYDTTIQNSDNRIQISRYFLTNL